MPEKRFTNIEHDYENAWIKCNDDGDFMIYAIYKELDESLPSLEDLLNGLHEENEQLNNENKELKKQLRREETDKKRLMSYLMRYKGFGFDEIVDDYFNEPYYDNWWEDGFYEFCWDEYLKEKSFDGCDEE